MDTIRVEIWQQWNRQEERRLRRVAQEMAYIQLNDLYLSIERGEVKLNVHLGNHLRVLVGQAYDRDDQFREWWTAEFVKLPNWNNV